jgi:hypothetical protein
MRAARTATGVAAVLALTACGTQVGTGGGDEPPPLLIGSASSAVGAADTASHSGRGGAVTLDGTLPTGPDRAATYRYGADRTPQSQVRDLASALGLSADPVRRAHGWEVSTGGALLRVRDGDGEWSYSRAGLTCPAYLVDVESEYGGSTVSCAAGGRDDSDATPAVPVPTDAQALAGAAPVLALAGLDDAARVLDAGGGALSRTVVADPVVAGLPTTGIRSVVDVDSTGVLGAYGRLGATSEGPTYPIVSARTAYDRLVSAPRPLAELACPASKDGSTVCPEPTPLVVTGAVLGLELAYDAGAPVLVPAWLFSTRGSDEPLAAIAVEPRYLADPAPDTGSGPGSDPGSGSSPGSGGASEEPPVDSPVAPPAQPGTLGAGVSSASIAADGRTLTLIGWGGVCATYSGIADEGGSTVKVQIVGTSTIGPDEACIDMAQEVEVQVLLERPLGSRTVTDVTTGEKIPVTGR